MVLSMCTGERSVFAALTCSFSIWEVRMEACNCAAQVSSQLERLAVELETAAHPALDELTATVSHFVSHKRHPMYLPSLAEPVVSHCLEPAEDVWGLLNRSLNAHIMWCTCS